MSGGNGGASRELQQLAQSAAEPLLSLGAPFHCYVYFTVAALLHLQQQRACLWLHVPWTFSCAHSIDPAMAPAWECGRLPDGFDTC